MTDIAPPLKDWQNFFVIVGTSAGALTGLQFVVIAPYHASRGVEFEARYCRLWHANRHPLLHSTSSFCVDGRTVATTCWPGRLRCSRRRHRPDRPDGEDWFWYIILPLFAHAVLVGAAVMMWWNGACAGPQ